MDISVIIPLFNEEESLPELYAWIERVMKAHGYSFEVIFVNDGSTDTSWEVIERLATESENVKGIKFRRNYGKSPALYCGFEQAQCALGGVNGCEIDEKTMQSKIVKNLYVCGEAIDICGECGGYNLHFAFASGLTAGENL